jgi:uncharacterized membrane protein
MITKVDNSIENLKNLWIEIFLDSTNKVSNIADGSVLNATAFGTAKVAQKAIKDIAITEAKLFPDTATGEYLDKCAALYGVSPRRSALGASTYIRVFAAPGTIYNEDTIFVNKNGIRFQVDQPLTVGPSGYGYVGVRSINAGYVTNVAPNSITTVNPQPIGHIECTNEYYAIGGRDSEDDETFRVRIKNNLNVLSKGTIEYYTQIFQNLDERVLKVMNVGLDENGYFVLYLVSQNGIYFLDSELEELLAQAKDYFGLFELNLDGNVAGIVLKNAEWFFIGSERGMDFRLDIDPDYDTATVRKNIQVALTKYLDFRFWTPGEVIQWDDLLDIVKKAEGVKYVPDEYFFPYYDEQVPINQLPRIKGFVMRDAKGNILYDNTTDLSPMFYPQDSGEVFRGLSDNSLSLSQQAYFTVVDEQNNPVEGARISVGSNSVITDANGQATLSLINGSYNYTITKQYYETLRGSFVILNASVSITNTIVLAPWTVTFNLVDEKGLPVEGAQISAGGKQTTSNINGIATLNLKNGTYPYVITKLGYEEISGKSFVISDGDININETLYFHAWQTTFTILSEADSKPIPSAIIEIGNNSYVTNSQGQVTVPLINGTYNLTIKKVGYQETKKTIVILNQDTTITYTIPLFEYNVVMTVVQEDGLTPIAGAAFSIKNSSVSGITDSNGQLSFKLVNGSYDYLLTKKEFDDLSGSFNINNSDLDLELTMTLKHFTVLISAVDENGDPVKNALVNINNEVLTTNDQGQVTALLQNGNYPFTITKIGYNDYTGNVVVTDQNTSIVANMTFYLWQILFTIKGKNNLPLNNASLNIYGQTYQSDKNGQIEVRLKNGTYPYFITYLGYDDYQSNLVVLNKNESIDVLMQEKTYAVIFSVTGLGGIALQGVTITVGDKSTTTNEGGIATLSLVNGSYSYTTNKDGYVTSSGDFIVNNAEVPISVNMTPMSYDIVFKVTDDNATSPNPLANVEIKINDQTLSTNNQGEVSLRIYGGDYVVSYTLAGYVSVTQEISIVKDETFEQILKKIWNLIFSVVAATKEPLVGATVRVQGSTIIGGEKTLTTKADGTTDPIEITNGQYTYGASMKGYSPEEGSGEIKDADKTQTVDLVFGFETTFIAKEGENPIQGVSIIVDNVSILTTGTDGTAKLNLSNGQHTYTYAKDGYMSGSGNITVAGTTQSIDIALIAGGLVTFTAVYNENPLAGVEITINNATRALPQTITTNAGGIVTIELPNGNYQYTTHITGYKDKEATAFTVNSANLPLPVDLTYYKYYTVDFSTLPAVEGVSINIGRPTNDASIYIFSPLVFNNIDLTTNSEGKASTQLLSGTYKFTATKDKYLEVSENFTIEQSNKSITISMSPLSTVTFTVKDQSDNSPIKGVSIKMTGINNPENVYVGTTDETGVATMAVQQGGKSYVGVLYDTYNYTVTPPSPYQSTSGTLEVNTSAINKEVLLIGNYDVTFNVKGKRKTDLLIYDIVPLENAIITPDNDSSKQVTTNAQGQAVISLKAGIDHDYSIQAEGYITREGTTEVLTSPITLDWTLNIATDFTFVLRADTESGPFIKGASIHVTSVEGSLIPIDITKETDTAGIAIFSLAEGTYDVVITAPNYKFEPLYNISVQDNVPGTLSIVGTGSYDLNVTVNRNNVGAANRTVNLYSSTMSQNTVLGEIFSEMGCVLFKRTGDKAGTFIRLDKNTRLKYFDGSPAKTDGTEGDVMVYMPEYYYKYENLGGTKFAYRFSRVSLGDDWIHVPASLIGAYMCYCTGNKMYSRSRVTPTASTTWTNFNNYAIARGTGYQMIDYWQHCQIAMLFYAKYKNRNSQAVLGVGSATYNPITTAGGTDNLGNNDTQQTTSGWVNFQGIEGVHGGAYECVGGVSISNRVWTITNPDGTTRTINAGTSDGWITKMALENGPYFDMVPTAVGGSNSTYYSDYYWQGTGTYVLCRSSYSAVADGGVACASAAFAASISDSPIGSRLAFRGVLTESKSVSDYAAITAV